MSLWFPFWFAGIMLLFVFVIVHLAFWVVHLTHSEEYSRRWLGQAERWKALKRHEFARQSELRAEWWAKPFHKVMFDWKNWP